MRSSTASVIRLSFESRSTSALSAVWSLRLAPSASFSASGIERSPNVIGLSSLALSVGSQSFCSLTTTTVGFGSGSGRSGGGGAVTSCLP